MSFGLSCSPVFSCILLWSSVVSCKIGTAALALRFAQRRFSAHLVSFLTALASSVSRGLLCSPVVSRKVGTAIAHLVPLLIGLVFSVYLLIFGLWRPCFCRAVAITIGRLVVVCYKITMSTPNPPS